METDILKHIRTLLKQSSKKIVISSHKNPDGDAIGSGLAMYHVLKELGHEVSMMVPNHFPKFLAWMDSADEILIYQDNAKECREHIENADIIVSVDYSAFHRTGAMKQLFIDANATKVLIDHHIDPTNEFELIYSVVGSSSTAELVYNLIVELGEDLLTEKVAIPLYVGIMTDTGCFSFACDNPSTFMVASKLVASGIDARAITQKVYNTNTESRTRLLGYSLSERLTVLVEHKTAFIYLTKEDLEKHDHQVGDTEGLVNYALGIEGVEFAALFTERDNLIRISFRSKKDFDVNNFARTHFDGGGHKNAAGGNSYASMENTISKFKELLPGSKIL